MKYANYKALDFVKDEEFLKWVKSPDEKSDFYWESWMQNHPDKRDLILEARRILLSIDFPAKNASEEEIEEVFKQIMYKERLGSVLTVDDQRARSLKIRKAISFAASILLIAVITFTFYHFLRDPASEGQTVVKNSAIKENPPGRKSKFRLGDGSTIELNSSSRLTVAEDFGVTTREVFLSGEAYFEISQDSLKPFVVHAGDLSVMVTGTAFNVRSYRDSEVISVAVVEGEVNTILKMKDRSDTLSLLKTDMAVYERTSSSLIKTSFDYLETVGWKDGIIKFNDIGIKEAFDYLEAWYGVTFYIKDQDKIVDTFYGEFQDESLEHVLNSMGRTLRFDYQINDKQIIVEPKTKK